MGSDTAAAIRQQYESLHHSYERLVDEVKSVLRDGTRTSPRHIEIEGRAKDAKSVQGKVLRKQYTSIDEFDDLAGVRAICKTRLDLDLVEQVLKDQFFVIRRENKSDELLYDKFGYRGIHYVVRLTEGDRDLIGLRCEVQVRTQAEHLWNDLSHGLFYKKDDSGLDGSVLRGFNRLMVLMELFDEGVMTTIHSLGPQTDTPLGAMVRYLEEAFRSIAGDRNYDRELSGQVTESLYDIVPGESDADKLSWLRAWVDDHHQKLRAAIQDACSADQLANIFSRQPEALLIYSLIERDPYAFRDRWADAWDISFLQYFQAAWGRDLFLE